MDGDRQRQAPRGRRDRTRTQRGNETRKHVQCCHACVQGRGYNKAGSLAGKRGGKQKKKNTHKQSRGATSTEQEGGGGTGRSKRSRRGDTGGEKKTATPGGRTRSKSPEQVKKEAHQPHKRGREKRPVLGARKGPRMDEDPLGPARRVAGSGGV